MEIKKVFKVERKTIAARCWPVRSGEIDVCQTKRSRETGDVYRVWNKKAWKRSYQSAISNSSIEERAIQRKNYKRIERENFRRESPLKCIQTKVFWKNCREGNVLAARQLFIQNTLQTNHTNQQTNGMLAGHCNRQLTNLQTSGKFFFAKKLHVAFRAR